MTEIRISAPRLEGEEINAGSRAYGREVSRRAPLLKSDRRIECAQPALRGGTYRCEPRATPSKLGNALFFFELDRRLRASGSPITAVGCHPGAAATDLGRYMGAVQILLPLARVFLNSAAKGAWPALQAATGRVTPGEYYGPTGFAKLRGVSGVAARAAQAQDPALSRRLWDVSVAMTGIDPGLPPVEREHERYASEPNQFQHV
jgi:NAD(P)-dependent dehydrogenase (short-subunit alcohol dehydrogenase family)